MVKIIIKDQFYDVHRESIIEFDDERYNCILEGKDYDDVESLNSLLDTSKHIVDKIYDGLDWLEDVRKFDDDSLGILLLISKPNVYSRYSVKKIDDDYYLSIITDTDRNTLFSSMTCGDYNFHQVLDLLDEIIDLIQYAKDKFIDNGKDQNRN